MKKWIIVISGFLFFSMGNMSAQKPNPQNVMLQPTDSITNGKPRALAGTLNAILDASVLTINFSSAIASQIVISQQSLPHVVYADSFASSTQIVVDLENEGIGEGHYLLWLFAFGEWWEGEFVVEDENE